MAGGKAQHSDQSFAVEYPCGLGLTRVDLSESLGMTQRLDQTGVLQPC